MAGFIPGPVFPKVTFSRNDTVREVFYNISTAGGFHVMGNHNDGLSLTVELGQNVQNIFRVLGVQGTGPQRGWQAG